MPLIQTHTHKHRHIVKHLNNKLRVSELMELKAHIDECEWLRFDDLCNALTHDQMCPNVLYEWLTDKAAFNCFIHEDFSFFIFVQLIEPHK